MIKSLYLMPFLFLFGCSTPDFELKKDSLTGQEYCNYQCKLNPLKMDEGGELILKYFKTHNSNVKGRVKAILKIRQDQRREYDINPDEKLNLLIDGVTYTLDLLHTTKIPDEEVHYNDFYMPNGRSFHLGSVKEVTKRGLAFYLPEDMLSKILKANEVYFKLVSSSTENPSAGEELAIILKFDPKNLVTLQEFKSRCLIN